MILKICFGSPSITDKNEFHMTYKYERIKSTKDVVQPEYEPDTLPFLKSSEILWTDKRGASEIYVFGCNSNNQLGVGDSTDRATPALLYHDNFKFATDLTGSISERGLNVQDINALPYRKIIPLLLLKMENCFHVVLDQEED